MSKTFFALLSPLATIGIMRSSGQITEDLLQLMNELWCALENEGANLKGRIVEATATDQRVVSVAHYAAEDRHLILRKRARNGT